MLLLFITVLISLLQAFMDLTKILSRALYYDKKQKQNNTVLIFSFKLIQHSKCFHRITHKVSNILSLCISNIYTSRTDGHQIPNI